MITWLYDGSDQGPVLQTQINFNPSMICNYIHHKVWDEITHPFPNFTGEAIKILEWISDFIPHSTGPVVTYPCWD